MVKYFRGQPPVCFSGSPNRSLIGFLQTILAGLDVQQTVGEQFSQERLAELGAEFNLADRDWAQLYFMVRRMRE
jgi:hypothetical protein